MRNIDFNLWRLRQAGITVHAGLRGTLQFRGPKAALVAHRWRIAGLRGRTSEVLAELGYAESADERPVALPAGRAGGLERAK